MMRALIAACLAVTCSIALSAQYPQTGSQKANKAAGKDVTVQGCLQAGDQPNTFLLANVMKPEAKPTDPSPTGTAGTTDPDISALKGSSLRLIGSPAGMNLSEHVGHTVEVSGALAPKEDKPAADPAAPAGTTGKAGEMRKLNVKAVKHIATTCTAR